MKNSKIVAIAALGLVGAVALVGCSSSSSSDASKSASPAASSASASKSEVGGNVLPPIMVMPGTKTVSAKVGNTIVFKAASDQDAENSKIATDNEAVLKVSQGGKQDGAWFNPGAEALAPGTAVVTVTTPSGVETVTVTVS